jgi:DNA-binding transcriptional ArsR family regulator
MTAAAPVEVFAALGDRNRQRLLEELIAGRSSAADLASLLQVTRQAVEKQLRILEHAGLVTPQRLGRRVSYRVRPERLADSAAWLAALADRWDRQLALVQAAAQSEGSD